MNKALDLLREIRPSLPKEVLELWCKDRDAFLASHPAVEQAGGDERAAFEAAFAAMGRPVCRADYDQDAYGTPFDDGGWTGWQARAALAQPSPAQAEAERPEVVAYFDRNYPSTGDAFIWSNYEGSPYEPVMTVSQHERIVGELRADRDSWAEQAEQRLADWDEMRKERDAALARVAELELKLDKSDYAYDNDRIHMRGLAARAIARAKVFDDGSDGADAESARSVVAILRELLAVGPAQAQHSVPDGYRLIRLEHFAAIKAQLNPEQVDAYRGRNIYDEDKVYSNWNACRSALDEIKDVFQQIDWDAENELAELLAAAPGKEVPQAWIDVQADRRRQVEVEGWTPEHDDGHACDEIAAFACFYAMPPAARDWDTSSTGYGDTLGEAILPEGWEPKTGDRRRELVKAASLILAEIERLDRAAPGKEGV
ncbi:TPA: hypothetical protein ACHS1O_004225 [Pseudomonas aeruginosa]